MIHAFLFVIRESDNRESHGPKFHQIMFKINAETQLSISVYHSFHDEVNFYKTHVWRCEGVCRNRAPYFGWLRRAMNRKPGPNDTWWSKHQQTCGGQYVKVSEPEKREKPKPGKEPKANNFVTNKTATSNGSSSKDIRQYFTPVTKSKDTSSQMPSFAAIPNNTSMFDDISYASDFSILMSPTKPTKPMIKTVFDSVQTNSDLLEQATAKSKPAFIPFAGDGHLLSISSSVCSQPNRKIISPLVNLFSSNKNMENQTNNKPIEITIVSETKKTKPPNHTVSGSANINVITLDDSFEYSSFNYEKRSLSISETNSLKKVCTKVHADCITLD